MRFAKVGHEDIGSWNISILRVIVIMTATVPIMIVGTNILITVLPADFFATVVLVFC